MIKKYSIQKLSLNSIHADTVVNLTFALGGISHIVGVDNCMSRLRITLSAQPSTEDRDFLSLGALGIVRASDQIHLIYGTSSIAIKDAFLHLLNIYRNPRALSLIASLGGVDNIAELSIQNNEVNIQLNAPPNTNLDPSLIRNGLFITINSQENPISAAEIQHTIIFWNLLLANIIFELVQPLGIKKVSACRSRLRISISSTEDPKLSFPFLHVKPTPFDSNEQELQLPLLSSRGEDYVNLLNRLLK
ncbi:MAG: hypothetical protein ACRC9L_08010 [Brevinema sp.]